MANRHTLRKTVDTTTASAPNTTDTAQHTRCHWSTIRHLPCPRPGSQGPTCPDTVPDTGPGTGPGGSPSARAAPHPTPSPSPPQAQAQTLSLLVPKSGPLLAAHLPQGRLQCVSFTGQRRNGSRCLESPLRGRHAFHLSVHSGHRSGHLHRSHSWRYERWPRSSHRRQ